LLSDESRVTSDESQPGSGLVTRHSSPVTPKLTDFGLARWLDAEAGVTSTGAMLGTPRYMAPEQAAGRNAEVRAPTDVHALGARPSPGRPAARPRSGAPPRWRRPPG